METTQARHETEESLILAQFGTSHNISHKLQNGGQSTEGDPLEFTGDSNWNHYKLCAGAIPMKRHRENSNSPATVQGLFDQASYMMNGELMNGELKHEHNDQSILVQQHKKLKINSDIKVNDDMSSNLVGKFPEFTMDREFKCNTPQTEITLDKRNCHFPNGDIFGPPRNKQVLIPNGSVSSPSTSESTPGDLLEKTLSQYYPEQVSIAQQISGVQLDAANGSLANKLQSEGAQPHSSNSGLSSSAQIANSQQKQPRELATVKGGNNYHAVNYVVNGYPKEYEADHQHQQQYQQQLPSYSSQDLAPEKLPGMIPPANISNTSRQHQNGPQCYPDDINPQGIYLKNNQELNENSVQEGNTTLQAAEKRGYKSNVSSELQKKRQNEECDSGQHQHHGIVRGSQYGIQPQTSKNNDRNPCGAETTGCMGSSLHQPGHAGLEKGMENKCQQSTNFSSSTPHQRWTDVKSLQSQKQPVGDMLYQEQEQDMWRGFPTKPLSEEQRANPKVHSQILEPNPMQIFHAQGVFADSGQGSNSFQQQQQDCIPTQKHCGPAQDNTAPEWQHSNSKAPEILQSLSKKIQEQCNFPLNQQTESHYLMQSEHLSEDHVLHDILSPGFSATHPQQQQQHCHLQRPMSHPPQFEEQQLKSPNYRPRSQPQPSHHQFQPNQPLRNSSSQSNNQHFSYNTSTEMQQSQHERLYRRNSGSSNLKQFQPQRPNNHCHQPDSAEISQTSTQSSPHFPQGILNQQVSTQICPKAEQQTSCTQFQRGTQLPLRPTGTHEDFQRHAVLRTHLLQRQERQGPPHQLQSINDIRNSLGPIKIENGPRFEPHGAQQQMQHLQMQNAVTGGIQIKQEKQQVLCEQSSRQGSILASMEQSLRQYDLSPVFEKKSLVVNSSNKVKVESSGPITVLSTNTEMSGMESLAGATTNVALKKPPNSTPKKEQLLHSFIESPMKLLDTPIKNLLDTPLKTQYDIASCHCVEQIIEKDEGPYYTHLGSAPTVVGIRELMEKRSGFTGCAIRIEKVIYTGKEGKSTQGCPIAKWVIRRSSVEEKILVLVRERIGHTCDTACIIVVILVWEGILPSLADRLYSELNETLRKHGALTQRRCAHNEEKTCACQGLDPDTCGASFSFGCSWSMYYNGCKFARSKNPRKFKLLVDDMKEEEKIEHNFQSLATQLAPLYKALAPEAYGNQVEHEHRAPDCRLGLKEGRPFSGVTACLDFCAHAHRDLHNMPGGSTVVCTLTKEDNREIGKIPDDEQLHVLPLYKASSTDEFGSEEGQQEKIKSGAIQVLSAFRRQVRMLPEPAKSCRQKKMDAKKAAANKNAMLDSSNDKGEKALQAKLKAGLCENRAQNIAMPGLIQGAVGATLQSGQQKHPFGAQPQQLHQQLHESTLSSYSGSANAASYPKFPEHSISFPSTSKPSNMYPPQPPTQSSPFQSPLRAPNSYMNGSNHPYLGYQCNGGMPLDNYHPYYSSNPKQLDIYQQQRPVLYSEQQYGIHQHYGVNYAPRFGETGLHVNGYNTYSMRPVPPMRPYAPYGPNGASDAQFMDPFSRATSTHEGLNYTAAVSKSNHFGGYPKSYLSRTSQILPQSQESLHMQIKTEMGIPHTQMLSAQISGGCLNLETKSGLDLPNGSLMCPVIKQEPGTPQTPTTPRKPEIWSDNEHNFLDPEIGGVAVAPTHGSVLIECAKRELHATTPIKNPDRNHPTRISLVFYQHKNLNEAKHGLAMREAKMAEKAREKEEDAERNGCEGTLSKGSKKALKREHPESSETTVEPPYKRFMKALLEGSVSGTTNTLVSTAPYAFTKVTGPYSHFV